MPMSRRPSANGCGDLFVTPEALNKAWGLNYWGQRINRFDEVPPREGALNPGYRLEWERFQQAIATDFLSWQAAIVRELKRPGPDRHPRLLRRSADGCPPVRYLPGPRRPRGQRLLRAPGRHDRRGHRLERRHQQVLQAIQLPGHGDDRPDDRLELGRPVPALRRAAPAGRLRQHPERGQPRGLLALALPPLRPGDLLEGRPGARPRARPGLRRGRPDRAGSCGGSAPRWPI